MPKPSGRKIPRDSLRAILFIAAAVLPVILWCIAFLLSPNLWQCGFGTHGWVGSLLIGLGLASLLLENDDEAASKRRVRFGLICLAAGVVLTAISAVILYHPSTERLISYNMSIYYSINQFFSLVIAYEYFHFRVLVDDILRQRHISKNRIKKLKAGLLNKMTYRALHRECGLGWMYGYNLAALAVLAVTLAEVWLLGWIRGLLPVTCALMIASAVMGGAHLVIEILHKGGTGVIGARIQRILLLIFSLATVYGEIKMASDIIAGRQL